MSSSAASSAAGQQAAAADRAAQAAQAQQAQVRADLSPYRDTGQAGLSALQASLGLGGGGPNLLSSNGINSLTFQPTQAQLEATPGYQFIRNQGMQGVASSNAAQGRGISGAALKGAAQFAEGLAGTTLGQQQQIFQSNLGNVINPLQNLANLGQTAATQTGQNSLASTNASNAALIGGANASAAGTIGSANALSSGLNSLGSAPLNYQLYSQLLNGGGSGGGGGGYQDTTTTFY